MKLNDLIVARDALVQSQKDMRQLAMKHILFRDGVYEFLIKSSDRLYMPIARLNRIIGDVTKNISLEVE
jgi:hypothetical protein